MHDQYCRGVTEKYQAGLGVILRNRKRTWSKYTVLYDDPYMQYYFLEVILMLDDSRLNDMC